MMETRAPTTLPARGAAPEPLPRWFLWLPALVLAAWFPIDPYWASDDFFALHWAQDFAHVLEDLTGPWYGAADLFFFWRPLITFSLWLELQVAGAHPFLAHFDNALVHAISALFVGCLWRRFLSDGYAFLAGLAWGLSPIHVGAIGWAIARTDGFSCCLALASAVAFARRLEGTSVRTWPSLVWFGLALACKETVLPLPGMLVVLALALDREGALGPRLQRAVRAILPHALLLGIYLAYRLWALGRLGGYSAAAYEPVSMAIGLGRYAIGLLDPLAWVPLDALPELSTAATTAIRALGALPALAALWFLRRGRGLAIAGMLGWFLLASVPMASFFAQADNHHNLRYFCLAFAGLAGLLAAGGRAAASVAILCALAGLARVRQEQHAADVQSRGMHQQLLRQLDEGTEGPWFVAGLPHQSPFGIALQLHFGIDRLVLPPFGKGGVKVFAHRPTFVLPGTVDLNDGDGLPMAPPGGTTLAFRGSEVLVSVPQRALPELPLEHEGEVDCTSENLYRLNDKTASVRIRMPGVRAEALRVTFFTASGYLGALVPNHAPAGAADGELDLLTFFQTARWTEGSLLIHGLEPSTIMDLEPAFPVLVEGGTFANGVFTPTHRARRMLTFRFDRGLPHVMRGGKLEDLRATERGR